MKRLSGFSLMEMMVVLLIVAVVAAASAPMVNRKMLNSAAERSPWVWTGLNNSIAYNLNANPAQTAIIGATSVPGEEESRLYIESDGDEIPHMLFGAPTADNRFASVLRFDSKNGTLGLTSQNIPNIGSVVLGNRATTISDFTTAIGSYVNAAGIHSIAIGYDAETRDDNGNGFGSIAIGAGSRGLGDHSLTLGHQAETNGGGVQEVALGWNAYAEGTRALAIGPAASSIGIASLSIGSLPWSDGFERGTSAMANGNYAIAIGTESSSIASGVSLGVGAQSGTQGSIAIGTGATVNANAAGAVNIGDVSGILLAQTRCRHGMLESECGICTMQEREDEMDNGANPDPANFMCERHQIPLVSDLNGRWYCPMCLRGELEPWEPGVDPDAGEGEGDDDGYTDDAIASIANNASIAIGGDSSALDAGLALGHGADAATQAIAIGNASHGRNGAQATGSNSIAIGNEAVTNASPTTASGVDSIAIGTGARATRTNAIAIGCLTTATGENSVAIGNGATTTASNQIVLGTSSDIVYIPGKLVVAGATFFGVNEGTTHLRLKKQKLNGSRSTETVYMELIRDHSAADDAYVECMERVGGETIDEYAEWRDCDRRLKDIGEVFTAGLDEIKKLEVFNFTYKKDPDKTPRVGVMAQDLQKIFPKAVFEGKDGFLRIRMEDMFYALVNAVKQLDAKIEELKNNQVAQLLDKVANLEKQNKEQAEVNAKQAELIEKLAKQNDEIIAQNKEIAKQNKELIKQLKKLDK